MLRYSKSRTHNCFLCACKKTIEEYPTYVDDRTGEIVRSHRRLLCWRSNLVLKKPVIFYVCPMFIAKYGTRSIRRIRSL